MAKALKNITPDGSPPGLAAPFHTPETRIFPLHSRTPGDAWRRNGYGNLRIETWGIRGLRSRVVPALACLLLCAALLVNVRADPLASSEVRVVDGDSLEMLGARIRLLGIDAPERYQTCLNAESKIYRCGEFARTYLMSLIANQRVECSAESTDKYGRIVATCQVKGKDIGEAMVRAGWAIDYKKYSAGAYAAAQAEAKREQRGIWNGVFEFPEMFRRTKEKP